MKLKQFYQILEGHSNVIKARLRTLPNHIKEQAEVRMSKCPDCANAVKCEHCGCKVPALFYASTKIDAKNNWGPMLDEEEYESMKEKLLKLLPSNIETVFDPLKPDKLIEEYYNTDSARILYKIDNNKLYIYEDDSTTK